MRRFLAAFGLILLPLSLAAQQAQRPLKVMILYDMEGVSGVTEYRMVAANHPAEYAEGRKSLTADVNAAIAGLKAAGVSEIVVVDGHGSGNYDAPDVLVEQLSAPATMYYRDAAFDIYMESYDHSIDAIVAIGMHAGAGNRTGHLSHTYTLEDIEYRVNGVPFNESMILAAGAARLRIPVIAISGDDQLEKEIRRHMPWVKYAATKHAVNRATAQPAPRDEASRRIEAAVKEGVLKLSEAQLPQWGGPYRFALTFQDEAQARAALYLGGAEPWQNATTVQVRGADFEEGYRLSLRLMNLAGYAGSISASSAVVASQPTGTATGVAIADWEWERFLNGPTPPAAAGAAPKRRFWGAR